VDRFLRVCLEGAIAHQFRVETAIIEVVDLLDDVAVQHEADLGSDLIGLDLKYHGVRRLHRQCGAQGDADQAGSVS
jgi:hypothetical protein